MGINRVRAGIVGHRFVFQSFSVSFFFAPEFHMMVFIW